MASPLSLSTPASAKVASVPCLSIQANAVGTSHDAPSVAASVTRAPSFATACITGCRPIGARAGTRYRASSRP